MARLLEAAIVPLIGATLAAGQFTSGVSLVEVYATVTDARGEPVTGLAAADFRVLEDGEPQTVTAFAAGDFPLSVVVALDRSFSMAGPRLDAAKRAAAAFIGALRPDDEVMVLAVGSEVETITPPVAARDAQATRWAAIDAWGTTPLYDATRWSIDVVQTRKGRRALLIISDGVDRGSESTAAELLEHARRADVLVYPVAIGKERTPVLAELASVTGGRSIATDPRQLEPALAALARELRSQYLLGYTPARAASDSPGWRAIDVQLTRADARSLRIRARDGYFAK
jgi:Ca-activated chloride channel family protein